MHGHAGVRKTPSFINAAHTFVPNRFGWDGHAASLEEPHPPYMHDGSLPTLRDVILFYKRGGIPNPHLDTQIRPLRLSSTDIDALVDFLEALNGEGFIDRVPSAFPK